MALLIPNNKPLPRQIEIAENALAEAFARDLITMEELEKRLHLVQEAQSNGEISGYLADLPRDLLDPVRAEDYADTAIAGAQKSEKKYLTVLSKNVLRGKQLQRKSINAKVILGEQILDYSKTVLEPGRYYVELKTVLGETKIFVPPEYAVTTEIRNVMSEIRDLTDKEPDAATPEIIFTGKVILGSVKIKERNNKIIKKIKKLLAE
ncbi:MAG: LiaF-related protein [Spirochaetia bacterium]